jgi:hypothetical protein
MTSLNRRQFNRSLLALPAAALVGTGLGSLAPAAASAAPTDWNTHFLADTLGGDLMRQMRAGDGTWDASWREVHSNTTGIYSVSSVGISRDLHVVAAFDEGVPKHFFRNGTDGPWTVPSYIPSQSGPPGILRVAATSVNSQLHVFAANRDGGRLYHTVRDADGTWWDSWELVQTFGRIDHIATTRVGTTIDTAVVSYGEILHAIRDSNGTWSSWGNIEGAAGEVGNIRSVTLAGIGSNLHVVALTSLYRIHHAIRRADASWQRFREVSVFSGLYPFSASAVNAGGEMQLGVVDLVDGKQFVKHTIRRADGTWQPVRSVPTAGLGATTDVMTVSLAVTPR